MIKIAFYGLSGSGKSSSAKLTKEFFEEKKMSVEVIKLAYPIYKMQKYFYETANVESGFYNQDQKLMEDIAKHLRRINPQALIDSFGQRFNESKANVIINDDIREYNVDYPYLKDMGFKFIKIECEEHVRLNRLNERNDLSVVINSSTTKDIDKFKADLIIDTSKSDLNQLKEKIYEELSLLQFN